MPIISIIVPVYNADDYFEDCINSLISQDYSNIEILLVDDGSTDNCSWMCDLFAEKDTRIRVFHIPHSGVSVARNLGIEKALGEYLMFVDSDDWVEHNYCSLPLENAMKQKADVIIFNYYREGQNSTFVSKSMYEGVISTQDRIRLFAELSSAFTWNKLYRKELFDDIRFPVGYYYEDTPVAYKILHKADRVCYVDEMLYHYRKRNGSITSSKNHEKENDYFETKMMSVNDLFSWGFAHEAEVLRSKIIFRYIVCLDRRGLHSQECIDFYRSNEYKKELLSWRARVLVDLFLLFPFLFVIVCTCFGKRIPD